MSWANISIVFFVSHLAGDFLAQTDWQARNKSGGLGADPLARRALLAHVTVYTLLFLPALVWIGAEGAAWVALLVAGLIFVPHLVVDDGRLLGLFMVRVKRSLDPPPGLALAVDQSVHVISLWAVALLAAALA
jgi:hypothetical protein